MLHFLREYASQLGIDTVEIIDNDYYIRQMSHAKTFHLEKSCQLGGKYPYYMQFGFKPKLLSAYRKLIRNRRRMSKMTPRDYLGLLDFCQLYRFAPEDVDYVKQHLDDPLSKVIQYISRVNCKDYLYMYQIMFEELALSPLDEDQLIYVYHIET